MAKSHDDRFLSGVRRWSRPPTRLRGPRRVVVAGRHPRPLVSAHRGVPSGLGALAEASEMARPFPGGDRVATATDRGLGHAPVDAGALCIRKPDEVINGSGSRPAARGAWGGRAARRAEGVPSACAGDVGAVPAPWSGPARGTGRAPGRAPGPRRARCAAGSARRPPAVSVARTSGALVPRSARTDADSGPGPLPARGAGCGHPGTRGRLIEERVRREVPSLAAPRPLVRVPPEGTSDSTRAQRRRPGASLEGMPSARRVRRGRPCSPSSRRSTSNA